MKSVLKKFATSVAERFRRSWTPTAERRFWNPNADVRESGGYSSRKGYWIPTAERLEAMGFRMWDGVWERFEDWRDSGVYFSEGWGWHVGYSESSIRGLPFSPSCEEDVLTFIRGMSAHLPRAEITDSELERAWFVRTFSHTGKEMLEHSFGRFRQWIRAWKDYPSWSHYRKFRFFVGTAVLGLEESSGKEWSHPSGVRAAESGLGYRWSFHFFDPKRKEWRYFIANTIDDVIDFIAMAESVGSAGSEP